MKPSRFRVFSTGAAVALCLAVFALTAPPVANAQSDAASSPSDSGNSASPPAPPRSPVDAFRKLLAMKPAELNAYLTNYPAEKREAIRNKVQEYQMLPPPFAEQRLEVTELRWYLLPLLKDSSTNRAVRLAAIPEPYRDLVARRLDQWDIFPPSLKDEVIEYESTMHYFVGRDCVVRPQMGVEDLPEAERSDLERKLARWQSLPTPQRQQMYGCFTNFFGMTDEEKDKTLAALTEPERAQTEKVLDPIEKWPRDKQEQYIAAFRKFANMTPEDRQLFMKNAERWQKMAPEERQAYRDLVHKLAQMPPLPPGATLQPPKLPANTNRN